jgi:hypothetical protein
MYPTEFYCTECSNYKSQDQSTTQRYGYPICCGRTMNDAEESDE